MKKIPQQAFQQAMESKRPIFLGEGQYLTVKTSGKYAKWEITKGKEIVSKGKEFIG